jgi:hypothetical protein
VKSVDYQQVNTLLLRAVQLLERRVCVLEATKKKLNRHDREKRGGVGLAVFMS